MSRSPLPLTLKKDKKSRPEIRGGFIRMSLKQKVLYGEFRVN